MDVDSPPVGSDSAGCLEASACSTSLNWFCLNAKGHRK